VDQSPSELTGTSSIVGTSGMGGAISAQSMTGMDGGSGMAISR
jgi:hypothetical protein